jgi:hypothetical protein
MALKVRNWPKFQHYKNRRPPWIKLHRDLLEDRAFLSLPVASQALAPRLWLLASDTMDGSLPDRLVDLAWKLRMDHQALLEAAQPLLDLEYLEGALLQDSDMLASRSQSAILERETEIRVEGEAEKSPPPAPAGQTSQERLSEYVRDVFSAINERRGTELPEPSRSVTPAVAVAVAQPSPEPAEQLAPPAPPVDKPPRPKAWSTEACDDWAAVLGTPQGERIGRALKFLVRDHTWAVVRPLWQAALTDAAMWDDPGRFTPDQFGRTFIARLNASRRAPPGTALVPGAARGSPGPKASQRERAMVAMVRGGLKS